MHPLDAAPALQWWQDWPGWLITTVLALLAALASIAALAWELWRYHADAPRVEWSPVVRRFGVGFHLVLYNVGDAAAINPSVIPSDGLWLVAGPYWKKRIDAGDHIDVQLNPGEGVPADEIPSPTARVEYLTSPVRRRQRRAIVVRLDSGEHRVESLKA